MLTQRYLVSTKNLNDILKKIVDGVAPSKFNSEHLKSMGFTSSSDRALIPILKDLGFLTAEGAPTSRYHDYRDRSRSKAVMADALRESYDEVFHIRELPIPSDRPSIEGLFKSKHNSSDRVAQLQAMTFFKLLHNADLKATDSKPTIPRPARRPVREPEPATDPANPISPPRSALTTELHYTIQVHLPATKDIEVFNAIFRSLRDNLLS